LALCLRGAQWPRALVERLARDECADALFGIVAEGLADRFDAALARTYEKLFSEILGVPARPHRNPILREYEQVYVLSRVTLGADVAVTSIILDAVKRRFSRAGIYLVGPRKNWELFAADARIQHVPIAYRRGSLRDRTAHWGELRRAVEHTDALVIDPDSRLTQLGLLPVCAEENYLFFESRAYGGDGDEALPDLTRRWVREALGVEDACAYIAPAERMEAVRRPQIAVSLGVGENPAKRIAEPFEEELLRQLSGTGAQVWIDRGAGGEEAVRVERAIAGLPVKVWDGSFAGFAAIIRASDLYVGYDSAGQHVAAACGVPLVSIFAGFPCLRMFQRWRPAGPGRIAVVKVDDPTPERVLAQTLEAMGMGG
jgi:ADP-heptose:LPS heptosyltransferase